MIPATSSVKATYTTGYWPWAMGQTQIDTLLMFLLLLTWSAGVCRVAAYPTSLTAICVRVESRVFVPTCQDYSHRLSAGQLSAGPIHGALRSSNTWHLGRADARDVDPLVTLWRCDLPSRQRSIRFSGCRSKQQARPAGKCGRWRRFVPLTRSSSPRRRRRPKW
jgi:hypothetical protein